MLRLPPHYIVLIAACRVLSCVYRVCGSSELCLICMHVCRGVSCRCGARCDVHSDSAYLSSAAG